MISAFRLKYPKVRQHLHQGTSEQIAEMVARDRVDFAIATGSEEQFPHLVRLPVYRWHRAVVVPRGHPLESAGKVTLARGKGCDNCAKTGYRGRAGIHEILEINDEVRRMHLSAWNSLLTRWTFKFVLLKRAYTREQLERMASQSPFGRWEIATDGIGVELRLMKA